MKTTFKNVIQLLDYFKDNSKCVELLELQRWNGKPKCPHCGYDEKIYRTNRGYRCAKKGCCKKFSVTTGTVCENSKIQLRYWFAAIYLITAHKKGISSHQLARDLGITQKSAWFLNHRIREMLIENNPSLLGGTIEVDETFVGGKEKNKHSFGKQNIGGVTSIAYCAPSARANDKAPVFGLLQRDGVLRVQTVKNVQGKTLIPIMLANVVPQANVYSDEHTGYSKLAKGGFNHQTVKHKEGQYVNGDIHTQGIENFWSLFKRGIIGIYHHTSTKHLQRYCEEFSYRYNSRKITDTERFTLTLKQLNGRLTYKRLTTEKITKD